MEQNYLLQEAIERAKQLATAPPNSNSLKRPLASDSNSTPMKKFNTENVATVKEVIEVPQPAIGLVIGKGGEQVRNIMGLSGCDIQVGGDGDQLGFRKINLIGTKDQIDHAKLLITNLVTSKTLGGVGHERTFSSNRPLSTYYASDMYTAKVIIPIDKCGLIIGKNGENIKSLQERFDVKMQLVQDTKVAIGPKPLEITGYQEKVESARKFIEDNYCVSDSNSQAYNSSQQSYGHNTGPKCILQVLVPKSSVGLIIGKNGEQIKKISHESGAKIQFDNDEAENPNERRAILQGTQNQVDRAAHLIADLIESQTFLMHVPTSKAGLVIGMGGETIQQISAESGARVQISKQQSPNSMERIFEIKGKHLQIQKAIHLIKMRVGDLPQGTPFPIQGVGRSSSNPTMVMPTLPNFATPTITLCGMNTAYTSNPAVYNLQMPVTQSQVQPNYYMNAINVPMQNVQIQSLPIQQPQQTQMANSQQSQQSFVSDYSLQWIDYYRKTGMYDKAAEVEKFLMEKNKAHIGQIQAIQMNSDNMVGYENGRSVY